LSRLSRLTFFWRRDRDLDRDHVETNRDPQPYNKGIIIEFNDRIKSSFSTVALQIKINFFIEGQNIVSELKHGHWFKLLRTNDIVSSDLLSTCKKKILKYTDRALKNWEETWQIGTTMLFTRNFARFEL
jgi:hypothetical protein